MYLHSLTIQAVGPFVGRHTIDFARLGAGGLFLLEGPTGAGKSTVIDAVVFALYGKVASRDASEDRLRSGHAGRDVDTFVDLVLETGSGVYRVRRTPQYQRPKQRGTGTTTQQATVKLWRLGSPDAAADGELLSTRLDEAGGELQRIVGLDRDQFVQTIVLPQGEFAGFLRAKPEDRRGLLQKVFGTGIYEQLQVRLERMRAEVSRQVEDATGRVRHAAAGFAGAAGLCAQDAEVVRAAADRGPGADGDELVTLVAGHTARLRADADAAGVVAREAKEACAATQEALEHARALAAAIARRDALLVEQATLAAEAPDVAEAVVRRDTARRAGAVAPLLDGADGAERVLRAAEESLTRARLAAPDDVRAEVTAAGSASRDVLVAVRDECTGLQATLARVADLEAGLPRRREVLAADRAACQALQVEREQLEADRAGRPVARQRLQEQLDEARAAADGLAAAEERAALAETRLAAAEDAAALAVDVSRAEAAVNGFADAARAAVATEAAVRRARIAGIAGEIARSLVDGEPCPVCGADEHPRPASLAPDHVGAAQVQEAEAARSVAEADLARASSKVVGLQERLQARREAAGGLDQDAAKTILLAAQDEVERARSAGARRLSLERRLIRLDADTVALDARITELGHRVAAESARLEGVGRRIEEDAAEVSAALAGCPSVADRVAVVRDRAARAAAWLEALATRTEAETACAQRRVELASGLAAAGFEDGAAARAAVLPPGSLRQLEERIERHERATSRVAEALAAPDIAALAPDAVADVEAARATHAAADTEATRASAEAARLIDRAEAAAAGLAAVRAALDAAEAVRRDAVPVVRMANLAAASGSDNAKQLTLATYVLARRFEDVVAAANTRLATMSSGRFELVRSEEKEAVRARRTGLAMKVVDHHIEAERDPRTLSGGETFYVSLCLALGLADVVTAEAGGTDLGTLFVDEGFGTLDPETLEVVLTELGRLREGGRVVGVVSHVEALKQAIAERVEVRRLPAGGSTLTVRA